MKQLQPRSTLAHEKHERQTQSTSVSFSSFAIGMLVASLIAGCASEPPQETAVASPPAAPKPVTVTAAVAPAPVGPLPFDRAIEAAANVLFTKAGVTTPRVIVIDPLIDGLTGEQTIASRQIEKRFREIAGQFPAFEIRDFTSENVAQNPTVLVGTFTGVPPDGAPLGKPSAYRICLALADLETGKIVATGVSRATLDGVDVTRTPYYADSPVWVKDEAVDAYIKTCQGIAIGDPISTGYRQSLSNATTIVDAINAYDQKNYVQARELYLKALNTPPGNQLRVHAGLYMTNLKLGKRADAEQAFGKVVDAGLSSNRLAVKFLFQPGRAEFWSDTNVSGVYPLWLRQIAGRVSKLDRCLNIVGHTSRTGNDATNDKLSLARADAIKRRLQSVTPALAGKTSTAGMGSRENLVGSGTDDVGDLADRRVEFKVAACGSKQKT